MAYITVTLINFLILYFCFHCFLWNQNANDYWNKEKKFTRFAPPIWVWIILIIIALTYFVGLIIYFILFISILIGTIIDDDVIIDIRLSDWFKRTWIGRFFSFMVKFLNKKVSI